jgi:hypothetical protein
MSLDTADWSLLVSALGLSMVVGAGLFQALFVMPEYFSNPPASLRRYQQDRSYTFWLPLHVIILIAIVIAAVAGWHQDRRTLILAAAGCYTLCWVITLLFFIPGVIAFNKVDVNGPPSPELTAKGRTWMRRSWPRHALMAAAAIVALLALAG